jgi:ABC-2 type transport system permease protein
MGTIRMLATKPISRIQLLLSKFIAGGIYTLLVIIWLGVMSVVLGKVLFGTGDMMVLNSDGLVILQEADINWRYLGGFSVAFLALFTVSSLSICLSCFTDNSIGPIVATMALILLFTIIGTLDVRVFDPIKPYLFTTHMASWRSFFEDPLPISDILRSCAVLVAHNVVLISVSLYTFHRKDIQS